MNVAKSYNRRGLVGHWKYHGNVSALGTWYDISGNGNHGTLVGNALVNNSGLNLDKSSGTYLVINYFNVILNPQEYTIFLFFKEGGLYGINNLLSMGYSPTTSLAGIIVRSVNGILQVYNGAFRYTGLVVNPPDKWNFISFVTKDGITKITLNNQEPVSLEAGSYNYDNLYIGSGYNGQFDGTADNIFVYNRALSASEIEQIYHQTKGRYA